MTDHDNNLPVVHTDSIPEVKADWNDPMLSTYRNLFDNMANAVVARSTLAKEVEALKEDNQRFKTQTYNLLTERDNLTAENRNLNDQVRSIKDELGYKEEVLSRTRNNLADVMRERDQLRSQVERAEAAVKTADDDKGYAEMERDEWKEKHGKLSTDFESLSTDYKADRETWHDREADLVKSVSDMEWARDKAEDKLGRALSLAANIMRISQE